MFRFFFSAVVIIYIPIILLYGGWNALNPRVINYSSEKGFKDGIGWS